MIKCSKGICALLLTTTISVFSYSQQKNFWAPVSDKSLSSQIFTGRTLPSSFSLFQLNEKGLQNEMKGSPSDKRTSVFNSTFTVSFPSAPGQSAIAFRVVEAPVMDQQLAAKYPDIRSFSGIAVNDPSINIRFDISPQGFHGMIQSPEQATMYIDPVDKDNKYYAIIARPTVKKSKEFKCLTEDLGGASIASTAKGATAKNADDGKLRTYRLALTASGEFSQFWLNGTEVNDAQRKAKVLAALNTEVTRVNAVYEKEFSVHLNLVANNDQLIFLNPNTDPWTDEFNDVTQHTIDSVIGDGGYDVGHLVHKDDDNGNAGCIGCVCSAGMKGSGFSSFTDLANTENFVVDYLCHEIGHQFGARHTFTFSNENTAAQVEPGSGSTIMGYAGITGSSTDVQPHSDDYFNAFSIQEITDYIKTSSCAVVTVSGDLIPTANAGADYIIPRSTPFILTGSGTDANGADVLSYDWEQQDRRATGSSTIPTPAATSGPQFRSVKPTPAPNRSFPVLASIIDGTNANRWESLPSVQRTLNFRFTVRDNHAGAGSNNSDDMTVTVTGTAGPFAVTAPNTALVWGTGSNQTVTWDVASSNLAPINCATVNILLSTDGGLTFPTTLAGNTPNDGSQLITLPSINQTHCRIKIESVGNIFFDMSNTDFTIAPDFDFDSPAAISVACPAPATAIFTLGTISSAGYATPIVLSTNSAPAGTTVTYSPGTVNPGASTTVTVSGINTLLNGTYSIIVKGTGQDGVRTHTRTLTLIVNAGTSPIISTQPIDKQVCAGGSTTLSFATSSPIVASQWQVSTDGGANFTDLSAGNATSFTISNATVSQTNNKYRVVLRGACNTSISNIISLTVHPLPTVSLAVAPYTKLFPGLTTTLTATPGASVGGAISISWLRNTTPIPVVGNSLVVNVTGLGNYQVKIDEAWADGNTCSSLSQVVPITDSASARLFMYPNPSTGQFTVSYYNASGSATQQTITIFDSKGSLVYNKLFTVAGPYELHQVNINGVGRGVYYVKVSGADGKKIIDGKVLVQ